MSVAPRFRIVSLFLVVSVPAAWLACGGGSKPAESPADESTSSAGSEPSGASADTSSSTEPASSAPAPAAEKASPSAEPSAESAAPPASPLGSTDCGACIEKKCAKQAAACGKNTGCESTLDAIRGCSSGAASCIASATAPSAAKPKKLAAAYESCAKKALASKACKSKCE